MDVVVLSGTVGAGKTTVARALRLDLAARGIDAVDLDVDGIAGQAPAPPDDPFNERLVVEHLRAMRSTWEDAGTRVLILPRVVESAAQRDAYAAALGRTVRVVRIDASGPTRHRRLLARHRPGPDQDWHLARTDVLAEILARADVEELVVDNDDRRPSVVARQIAASLGWPEHR
ncbi:adenylyl-sulfate kinase [Cellulomonas sp. URHB0016]